MTKEQQIQEGGKSVFGEWQLCPKCLGEGKVWQQRGLPWLSDYQIGYFTCPVCDGAKILARPIISSVKAAVEKM